jgi:cephalosporin hydroxylase
MKVQFDTETRRLTVQDDQGLRELGLYSRDSFSVLSRAWMKVGWELKYTYGFSWFGRPIIQLPEDLVRIQELIYRLRPDVVIETGVAHGGSLIFYATLFKAMGHGRAIGVDVEIRPHNRAAIEQHELTELITLVEGNSVDPTTVSRVKHLLKGAETVLVLLDSNHSRAHVLGELRAYGPLVTVGSYIVSTDGVMRDLHDVPRGRPEWLHDNPAEAAADYLKENDRFILDHPSPVFSESLIEMPMTQWPDAYLKRVR